MSSVSQALYALLLPSGKDAAVAVPRAPPRLEEGGTGIEPATCGFGGRGAAYQAVLYSPISREEFDESQLPSCKRLPRFFTEAIGPAQRPRPASVARVSVHPLGSVMPPE